MAHTWGKGYLNGSQSYLNHLLEAHTEFVVTTMFDEGWLVDGALLTLASRMIVRCGMSISREVPGRFAKLAAVGLSSTISLYFLVNLRKVTGLAPVVGMPLPVVSFGGSAVLTVRLPLAGSRAAPWVTPALGTPSSIVRTADSQSVSPWFEPKAFTVAFNDFADFKQMG